MPTYVYACTDCAHTFEVHQSFSDNALTTCPNCAGKLRKVFNSVGIVFKGSGFYRNDSRSSGKGEPAKVGADSGSDSSNSSSSDSSNGSSSGSDNGSSSGSDKGSSSGSDKGSAGAAKAGTSNGSKSTGSSGSSSSSSKSGSSSSTSGSAA